METDNNTQRVAWYAVIFISSALLLAAVFEYWNNSHKPSYRVCWNENGTEVCDTFMDYKMVSLFGFDSCYQFIKNDSTFELICGDDFRKMEIDN